VVRGVATLKMEAICSSETSVESQRTTRRHIPEDDTLQKETFTLQIKQNNQILIQQNITFKLKNKSPNSRQRLTAQQQQIECKLNSKLNGFNLL
jgi:hypothetical protein